jgi:hypothetical protein
MAMGSSLVSVMCPRASVTRRSSILAPLPTSKKPLFRFNFARHSQFNVQFPKINHDDEPRGQMAINPFQVAHPPVAAGML